MKLCLFGRIKTAPEIEREVHEHIESMARSGHNPPPPEWTVTGGLPVTEEGEEVVAPGPGDEAPAAAPAPPAPGPARRRPAAANKPAAQKPRARKATSQKVS
ncbi:MAG: hypothetical protein ACR2HY_02225 [Acidimicrobiales bacterium]